MKTVSMNVPFSSFCKACDTISSKSKKDEKRKALANFISTWRKYHEDFHKAGENNTDSFFPAMRLLLPQFDRDRGAYGIKETMLAKLYIDILNLSKESLDAKKLLNYRAPKAARAEAGDFASVAEMVLKHRCPDKGTLTIADVNDFLNKIAICNAEKKKAEMKDHLRKLLCNTTAQEQKWLVRVILKDMRYGMSEASVLNVFHPDAKDLHDVRNSLSEVCLKLHDLTIRLHEIEISLFSAFRPMLANRAPPDKIEKLLRKNNFLVETKLDGERVQLHKDKSHYKFFSRSGLEYTHSYGESFSKGSLTPYIAQAFRSDVSSCILDGEMVGWQKHLECIGSKGQNFDVKSLTDDDEDFQPCFCVFDILFYNGRVLSNLPLSERLTYLHGLFTPVKGRLMLSTPREVSSKQEVIDALNLAIDNREEGIMVKDPSLIYKPNSRDWIKVKPEYMDNVMSDLDLLIIGGYYGEGRRANILSHFLLAVAAPSQNADEPELFHSFTKVGSGYSMQELLQLLDRLKDNWHPYDKRKPPSSIVLAHGHKEKPDLWIEPSKSQIVQVKAAEIISSDRFKTGCTLRFPRVEKVRYDKPWNQCMTLNQLQNLKQESDGKLATGHFTDDSEPSPKRKRTTTKLDVPKTLPAHFRPTDTTGIQQESAILSGKELCVLSSSSQQTKADLEKLIIKMGGTFVQNPGPVTFCVVSNKATIRVKNLIQTGKYDIVHADWLQECQRRQCFVPWTPSELLFAKEETSQRLALDYDEYGDSYHDNTNEAKLRQTFKNISKEDYLESRLSNEEIAEVEYKYFPNIKIPSLFRLLRVYLDDKMCIGDSTTKTEDHRLNISEVQLRYFGASITSSITSKTTHVIVHSRDTERLPALIALNQSRSQRFHIVTEAWVSESIEARNLLSERSFLPLVKTG